MKIKSIMKSVVALLAAGIFSTSCEVDTTTVMFEEDHDLSEASDTVFSVLGLLSKLQNVAERNILLGEVRGDLVGLNPLIREGALRRLQDFDYGTDTTYNKYRDYYAIVNNCNFFLSRADSAMERRGKKVFMKEYAVVSGFRAWAYLQLAQNYGEVPFYTHPLLSYSQIEKVMNDQTNRKGMQEICSYFIEDLKPYVDIEYPNYGEFTYGEDRTAHCQYFFFPIRLLLGDLYLWRGSCTGSQTDYAESAQYYRDYLYRNELYINPMITNSYTSATFESSYNSWGPVFTSLSGNGERISFIPFALNEMYGKIGSLYNTFQNFYGSESLKELVDTSYYCYVSNESTFAQMVDSVRFGTPKDPAYFSYTTTPGEAVYVFGDLRMYQHATTIEYDMPIKKYTNSIPHVTTYRSATVYLRLAEAVNRAGYPLTAFNILKYGLSLGNLMYYDANGEFDRLLASGYTFYDMGDNEENIGLHARGCGNAEMDTLHYSFPALAMAEPTRTDSIFAVEELVCNEMALETAFEGNRFYDLMRMAFRRGESFLAAKIARRDNPDISDEELSSSSIYIKLLDRDNWYLPMLE